MNFKRIFLLFFSFIIMFVSVSSNFKIYADETQTWVVDWFGSDLWRNSENKLQNEDVYYLQFYNSGWLLLGFSIAPSSVIKTSVNSNWDKVTLTFDVPKDGYFSNNYVYSYGEIVYTGRSSTNKTTYEVTCLKDTSYSSEKIEEEDSSFFGRLWKGLKDMWYSDGSATVDFLFCDDNFVDYWNNIGDNWCDFVKTVLNIDDTDTSTLNSVMTDIYNNDFSRSYWSDVDTTKIAQIQQTSTNLKQFWSNNVTVVDDDNNSYHYEVKNYNPVTKSYPSYLYDSDYFYEYIVYHTDTTTDNITGWLQKIHTAIIDLPNHVKSTVTTSVTNTYNYLFVPGDDFWDEWDLKFSNSLDDKFPIIQQVEDFTNDVGNIINSYSEDDFAVSSISEYFTFDNDVQYQTLSIEDDISNIETSYTGYVPKISIDLSKIKFIGYPLSNEKVVVMDFTWYLKYRPLIFTLIIVITYTWFIISLGKSLPRLIGNVADVIDVRNESFANNFRGLSDELHVFSDSSDNDVFERDDTFKFDD